MEKIKCINCETFKSMYESNKRTMKKLIKSIPRSELINLLQEMKIISKYPLLENKRAKKEKGGEVNERRN